MKIGVFVGSFNPVHKGHIKIVRDIIDNNYLDIVFIAPTHNYWDKNNLIDLKHRINMVKFYETDRIKVLEEFNNLPYTYQLMNEMKKKYKNDEFYLIIGADNIITFDKWKKYKELLKLGLIIYKRNDIDINHYLKALNKTDKVIVIDQVDNIDISSTKIRQNINNHEVLKTMLDKEVLDYIIKNNLYK